MRFMNGCYHAQHCFSLPLSLTHTLSLCIFLPLSVEFAQSSIYIQGNMVCKVEEAMKRNNKKQQQQQKQIQCNKGKAGKFKKSSSNVEEDGASSAILLLACIACAPSQALPNQTKPKPIFLSS